MAVPPIVVTTSRTLTIAELEKTKIVHCKGAGITITLPDLKGTTIASITISIINKVPGGAAQTIAFNDKNNRPDTRTLTRKRLFSANSEQAVTRWFPGSGRAPERPFDEVEVAQLIEDLSDIGEAGLTLNLASGGTDFDAFSMLPDGKTLYVGTQAKAALEFDTVLDAPVFSGRSVKFEDGIIQSIVKVAVPSGSPFEFILPVDEGIGVTYTFTDVAGTGPPPAVVVTVIFPVVSDVRVGTVIKLCRPEGLTSLFAKIADGSSFGGGSDASRDRFEVIGTGRMADTISDGLFWHVGGNVVLD